MRILVTGATGYIGGRLVPHLLAAGHQVRCLARDPARLAFHPWRADVEVARGDMLDPASPIPALEGCDAAYYLVHSMGGAGDFDVRDRLAAESFRDAAASTGLGRIVYLGGLGVPGEALSKHLRSRQEVGSILASGPTPVTELRAAVIIGSGSVSFEMLRYLTEVLPVMTTPTWVQTRCQPIAIRDVLEVLVRVLDDPERVDGVHEIGGPDILTYAEMMQVYAEEAGLRRRLIVKVPVLSPGLSSRWVGLVTPLPVGVARSLIDSLRNEVIVRDDTLLRALGVRLLTYREAVRLALQRTSSGTVETRWSDAAHNPASVQPFDPDWAGGTVLVDRREVTGAGSPADVYRALSRIGGDTGWYTMDWAWALRGLLDKLVGGVGLRRGRRHPIELRPGEALDFWRVAELVPDHRMLLKAEMKVPGEAWLEWIVEPAGKGSRLVQTARFVPRGLWGRLYWLALTPFHTLIFGRMARRIMAAAGEAVGAA